MLSLCKYLFLTDASAGDAIVVVAGSAVRADIARACYAISKCASCTHIFICTQLYIDNLFHWSVIVYNIICQVL